ncbi:RNase adapter RapZ [Oenococcus sicerae]|uniref:RapZ C-terminal domain-containing protein n=1 Tax=Oenococcus sicerae TaxID=2203724 RepID=A0AAJ1RA34_9LACO|nr:RNase adapter RapZ [Oenococcus sicerae]MDN6900974.1 hypothetical protein [Oenococcus sicerae]VDK14858.1 Nucleotide-binding protein YvcJ {ECO:0000255/HAMAP-Rule:MF_00636} [Oenococcus sicerae]
MKIQVISFGYKYEHIPRSSMLFDLRFLSNPYWDPKMRTMTGLDQKVSDYVMAADGAENFYQNYKKTIEQVLPLAIKKEATGGDIDSDMTIAFGCTGGQHRSVAFAQRLGLDLIKEGYDVTIQHRDLKTSLVRELKKDKQEAKS